MKFGRVGDSPAHGKVFGSGVFGFVQSDFFDELPNGHDSHEFSYAVVLGR